MANSQFTPRIDRLGDNPETTKQPDALDKTDAYPISTTPSTTSPAPSTSGSSSITGVSTPPYGPILFPQHTIYLPVNSKAISYRAGLDHHVISAKLLDIGTRVAICGALCPGVLPYPCPGQYAHQWALTGREGAVLGVGWVTALVPKADPSW